MPFDRVAIVSGSELTESGTDGALVRRAAFDTPELWAGMSTIAPGATTGWHHHGSNTTVFHMVAGSLRVEYGAGEAGIASAGDFVVVPGGVVHREIALGDEPIEAVVVRFGDGSGPLVVDAEAPGG
jgi:uncharacterized RmlC-like cupin family protein